ncbi:MAG: hypothetical protein J6C59_00185 [Muribaculaceae bacterium]|nr:hypothetical protein [Muribaculaceae bacterium]
MRQLKYLAMVSILICCTSSCSNKSNVDTGDSSQADTTQTEMTTPADHIVTPESARTLAKKVSNNEVLTSDDYNAMLDYVLAMGSKMGEAMKKVDIDALTKIPEEYPESDIFLKALEDAAASNKLDKDQLDKAKQFKKLIGEDEI